LFAASGRTSSQRIAVVKLIPSEISTVIYTRSSATLLPNPDADNGFSGEDGGGGGASLKLFSFGLARSFSPS
jgi:hypothetical protein